MWKSLKYKCAHLNHPSAGEKQYCTKCSFTLRMGNNTTSLYSWSFPPFSVKILKIPPKLRLLRSSANLCVRRLFVSLGRILQRNVRVFSRIFDIFVWYCRWIPWKDGSKHYTCRICPKWGYKKRARSWAIGGHPHQVDQARRFGRWGHNKHSAVRAFCKLIHLSAFEATICIFLNQMNLPTPICELWKYRNRNWIFHSCIYYRQRGGMFSVWVCCLAHAQHLLQWVSVLLISGWHPP